MTYRLYSETGRYNAGFGVKDELTEAISQLFVEAAQDALARLNRDHFKAEPDGRIRNLLAGLRLVDDHENDLRAISLSGISDSVEHLVSLLGKHDEGDRAELVTALALLGSADTAATLMQRYLTEDEDVRWATLKALDYIGGGESAEFIEQHGTKDENKACQALAERITH